MARDLNGSVTLTDEQEQAVAAVDDWFTDPHGKRVFKLHGYAGTGKTTVLKEAVARLKEKKPVVRVHFAAPTGKAAQVMRSKGLQGATTLHAGGLVWQSRRSKRTGRSYFHPLGKGEAGLDNIDLLVVDECSMLSPDMLTRILYRPDPADLFHGVGERRKNLRVLAIGDPAQLWPVKSDEPSPWAKEGDHDFRLETIHRSAEGSHILQGASAVRGPSGRDFGKMWELLGVESKPDIRVLLSADQVIAYTNQTRWHVVNLIRKAKGMPDGEPARGDRLVMLRNTAFGVNGEQVEVERAVRATMPASRQYEEFDYFTVGLSDGRSVDVPACMFEGVKGEGDGERLCDKTDMTPLTFADAITCHKAQGSEWDSVLIVDEGWISQQSQGWHYTAITRAREHVGLVSVEHLPSAWTIHEARAIRDEWWLAVENSKLTAPRQTALAIVEAMEDDDSIRVNISPEFVAEKIGKSASTVKNHMTALRKAGYLSGKASLTMLHFPGGMKQPGLVRQLYGLLARQAVTGRSARYITRLSNRDSPV